VKEGDPKSPQTSGSRKEISDSSATSRDQTVSGTDRVGPYRTEVETEKAATRSLLNTARLMDENPTLLRPKELETLEKVTEKIDTRIFNPPLVCVSL
jgi:hypothetical protein